MCGIPAPYMGIIFLMEYSMNLLAGLVTISIVDSLHHYCLRHKKKRKKKTELPVLYWLAVVALIYVFTRALPFKQQICMSLFIGLCTGLCRMSMRRINLRTFIIECMAYAFTGVIVFIVMFYTAVWNPLNPTIMMETCRRIGEKIFTVSEV